MNSPIMIGQHIYLHGRDKKFHSLSLADGEIAWSSDDEFGEYWSIVNQGDLILALDQKGKLFLVKANPGAFGILDRRVVSPDDPTWAHHGVEGDKLLVRPLYKVSVCQWK